MDHGDGDKGDPQAERERALNIQIRRREIQLLQERVESLTNPCNFPQDLLPTFAAVLYTNGVLIATDSRPRFAPYVMPASYYITKLYEHLLIIQSEKTLQAQQLTDNVCTELTFQKLVMNREVTVHDTAMCFGRHLLEKLEMGIEVSCSYIICGFDPGKAPAIHVIFPNLRSTETYAALAGHNSTILRAELMDSSAVTQSRAEAEKLVNVIMGKALTSSLEYDYDQAPMRHDVKDSMLMATIDEHGLVGNEHWNRNFDHIPPLLPFRV